MELVKGDVIEVNNENYIIIETLNYNYEKYMFVNKLQTEEEIGEEFYIFKQNNTKADKITDENLINILMEKFKKLINNDLNELLNKNIG